MWNINCIFFLKFVFVKWLRYSFPIINKNFSEKSSSVKKISEDMYYEWHKNYIYTYFPLKNIFLSVECFKQKQKTSEHNCQPMVVWLKTGIKEGLIHSCGTEFFNWDFLASPRGVSKRRYISLNLKFMRTWQDFTKESLFVRMGKYNEN